MFSVIIPLYNKAPYIEKAIRSVANQTCQEFELIVIDDGSEDNSFQVAQIALSKMFESYNDIDLNLNTVGRCRIIQQQNAGVSTARNNAVKLAKYDYLAFLDADDWWAPSFLEDMKNVILKYPDNQVFSAGFYSVKNTKLIYVNLGVDPTFNYGKVDYIKLLMKDNCRPIWIGASVISRNLFNKIGGFRKDLKYGEDFDMFFRAYLISGLVFLNKRISYYNQDADPTFRAIKQKLYLRENNAFWNLDYNNCQNDANIKMLIEYLKLRSFIPYYRAGVYLENIKEELSTINFVDHKIKFLFIYKIIPINIQNGYLKFMSLLSNIKRKIYLCIK